MTAWIAIAALAIAILVAVMFIGRLPRQLWQVVAAALLLAMAGYVLQGRSDLAAAPAKPMAVKQETAIALLEMRGKMDQHFSAARKWLIPADSFARAGDYQGADAFIRSGLHEDPIGSDLWTAQGVVLMLASDGQLSPPAKLAFAKARAGRPRGHPGPDYYEGLSALFEGRVDIALAKWKALAARAPASADWKPLLESQIANVERLTAAPETASPEAGAKR